MQRLMPSSDGGDDFIGVGYAAAMPAFVLSEITLRSNSAMALTIENTMQRSLIDSGAWPKTVAAQPIKSKSLG